MPELFDLVDEYDNVVGVTDKEQAHKMGHPHRCVCIFVFTPDNTLLVQHRKKDGLLDHTVGGHVRQNEDYDSAARRECEEELGVELSLDRIGSFYADERIPTRAAKKIHYIALYEARLDEEQITRLQPSPEEVIEMRPMTLQKIAEEMLKDPLLFTTGFQHTLNYYARQKGLDIPEVPIK